ncbi:hypothetical protein N8I77_004454 [Diaporthe amygdali]|uniref:Uncharacterized protein n=1 Tax=Phomopsis amygdali TaxID=1214568 RepID=A0AAD9W609_PHOAM|nr:uncharacterized protein J7T55_008677 [Diaporthe amygdali]KAJ0121513.1 hypothetical protein J7T55_008677 [Diaporthe amygdali]KAK2611077.1 hypothetical protein N8I77_004454 [Diaporthe amygdali]
MPITTPTEENCQYYGRFMHTLKRTEAEGLYWAFFFLVLAALFTASWKYGRVMESIEHLNVESRERQRRLRWIFWYCFITGVVGMTIVVLEAFVINTLQFCDGEPLISLYWSLWTMIQVGGIIAVWGICLHVRHMVTGKKHPPWALALGTPVLVVAGLGHYFQGKLKRSKAARSIRGRSRSRKPTDRGRPEALSEVPTIRGDSTDSKARSNDGDSPTVCGDCNDDFNAKVIGYTKDGDVIIRLSSNVRQEFMTRALSSSGITWDEPIRPSTSKEADIRRQDSISRGRSMTRAPSKGKEREDLSAFDYDEKDDIPAADVDPEKAVGMAV